MILPVLDRKNPKPLYQQIEDWMRSQIKQGAWPEHFRLRSENDLAAGLKVHRATVRQAIRNLVDEGLLVKYHGRGTFVASSVVEHPMRELSLTFSDGLIPRQIPSTVHHLESDVRRPTPSVQEMLKLDVDDRVFYLKRVRSVRDEPVLLLKNFLIHAMCPGIEAIDFGHETMSDILPRHFGLKFGVGYRSYEARAADDDVAEVLQIAPGAPVMFIHQITYLANGKPLEVARAWMRGDNLRLTTLVRSDFSGPMPNRPHHLDPTSWPRGDGDGP